MKRTRFFLMAFAAMMSVGVVSCDKDGNGGINNGDDNPGDGSTTVEWVDLGLPSGLLWAKCNLGATVPEECGNYYAWGETDSKEVYNWSTYRYCTVDVDGNLQTLTKYNTFSAFGTIDSLLTLESMDDAATAKLGNGARIPTQKDWIELVHCTSIEWTTENGVYGRRFISSNGNSIFLPVTGLRNEFEITINANSDYWSSSLCTNIAEPKPWAYTIHFDSVNVLASGRAANRNCGLPIRSVRKK